MIPIASKDSPKRKMTFKDVNLQKLSHELAKEFSEYSSGGEPIDDSYASYGEFQMVGHGEKTNGHCGQFARFYACPNVHLHNYIDVLEKNWKNIQDIRAVFNSCGKPSCPICYRYGWAVKQGIIIEKRLVKASIRFGQVEHITISIPMKDYGLSIKEWRSKAIQLAKAVGILGGVLIFHGFRYNVTKQWYWSPHWHVLGFILGGYSRCRKCQKTPSKCWSCDGFDGVVRRACKENGYIIKVHDERITIGGTAWYQLNHATIKKNTNRFHAYTWFGVCSYRKLKVTKEYKKHVCRICGSKLTVHDYRGRKKFITDYFLAELGSIVKRRFHDVADDWVERPKRNYVYSEPLAGVD